MLQYEANTNATKKIYATSVSRSSMHFIFLNDNRSFKYSRNTNKINENLSRNYNMTIVNMNLWFMGLFKIYF
jgi:hypothetical protein